MQAIKAILSRAPAVMGILNVTPDSFSDGGKYLKPTDALDHALKMQDEGADIIDVGAESTRPGAEHVPAKEQIARLSFFFENIFPRLKVPVSVDTRDVEVAEFAVQAGAKLLNDVSGLHLEREQKLELLKKHPDVGYVLMHSRGNPQNMLDLCHYKDLIAELKAELRSQIDILEKNGIAHERIILDLGVGFAKKGRQNLHVISCLKEFAAMGFPLLLGVSKKSFLTDYFAEKELREMGLGTELSHFLALQGGAKILRVHEVLPAKKTIRFFNDCNF